MLVGLRYKDKEALSYPLVSLASRSSFTLVELLVTSLILGVILTGLFLTLRAGESSSSISLIKLEVQEKARRTMDWLIRDVRQTSASQINNNAPSSSHIKFKVCLGHDVSNIIWSNNYIEYTYDSSLDRLTRTDYNTGKSQYFDNIIVEPFDSSELVNNKLIVTITGRKQRIGFPAVTFTLTNKIKLRNG